MGFNVYELRSRHGLFSSVTLVFAFTLGCRMSGPKGFLGVTWGDDASAASTKLHLTCGNWQPWEGNGAYQACFDIDHPVEAFGLQAYARLFQSQGRVEGLSLRFMHCGVTRDVLTTAIRKEFNLTADPGSLYSVFDDGSAVHFSHDSGDDTCQLTVAGPRFGKAFADYMLQQGFRNLGGGMGPR